MLVKLIKFRMQVKRTIRGKRPRVYARIGRKTRRNPLLIDVREKSYFSIPPL